MSETNTTTLLNLINVVVAGVISADGYGPISMIRELGAVNAFFHNAREQYASSPTIQAVLDLAASEAYVQEGEKVDLRHFDHQAALERASRLDELLVGAVDAGQVKQFLYDLTVHVAEAAGPGVFGRGEPISPQEGMYLKLLKEKLGIYQ